ncbi:hypothetical protein QNI16_11225 [Cytophagaceae bacterium YF14B1]|uniref:Uncharacterized protein n=1 Tax=Xanthocytophaga flava TaxID=3048013 RepID=A0AAE3QLV4_9BACT|nr:hypothetical protein [Xanthocytophaga flavus]MDJ1481056.1 hypothetical protein [Xanthocytophaga flavus]
MITFSETDRLHTLFLGGRNHSPTDREEHFQHTNSATNLIGVWIATSDSEVYTNLFKNLSLHVTFQTKQTPFQKKKVAVVSLPEGEIVFFPASEQVSKRRTVIGATIHVTDMKQVQASLHQAGIKEVAVTQNADGTQSVFLPPSRTHGLWLEFRQTEASTH